MDIITLLSAIINNSPAVIYLKDIQGKYILINKKYEELFHTSNEEIFGKTDHDLFPQDTVIAMQKNDLKVIASGEPVQFEEIVPHTDGLHTYISLKFPIFEPDGSPYGVYGISTKITERKKTEEALREIENRLQALADASFESIFISEKGICLDQNYTAERMFGYSHNEAVGQPGTNWILSDDRGGL